MEALQHSYLSQFDTESCAARHFVCLFQTAWLKDRSTPTSGHHHQLQQGGEDTTINNAIRVLQSFLSTLLTLLNGRNKAKLDFSSPQDICFLLANYLLYSILRLDHFIRQSSQHLAQSDSDTDTDTSGSDNKLATTPNRRNANHNTSSNKRNIDLQTAKKAKQGATCTLTQIHQHVFRSNTLNLLHTPLF